MHNFMKDHELAWSIKRAVVDFNSIEDPAIRQTFEEIKTLCLEKRSADALAILPEVFFEFDGGSLGTEISSYLITPNYSFPVSNTLKNSFIKIGAIEDNVYLTIHVQFPVNTAEQIDIGDFNEWLMDNGGWFAGTASGNWSYLQDDGGDCRVIQGGN